MKRVLLDTNVLLDAIVTRDNSGFQAATIPVLSPDEFLATLN